MYVFGFSYILATLIFIWLDVQADPMWSWSAVTTMSVAMSAHFILELLK